MKCIRRKIGQATMIAFVTSFAVLVLLLGMTGIASAVVYHQNEVISTDTTWSVDVHVINASSYVQVSDNVELTIPAGAVVKFNSSAYMEVRGTLNASGTASEKIVFTSLKDDSYGGDTNGDGGASSPAPGDWKYIKIYGLVGDYDGIGIFEHSIIRYGGSHTTWPANVYSDRSQSFTFKNSVCEYSERIGILSYISSPVITNSTLRHNGAHGLHSTSGTFSVTNNTFLNNGDHGLYNIGGTLSVTNNTFTNNTNYAAYLSGVTITSLRDNIGSGNGKNGWGISGTVSTNQTWDTFFPYIILGAGVIVNDDKILTLEPGVVVKFNSSAYMEVRGTLNASGTASEKIVFTSLKDDSYGGDTNGDGGASSPAPGDWKYIKIYGLVGDYDGIGIFEHSIIRYGGHQTANVYSDRSQSFTFKNSVCEYSERIGILSYISSPVITNSTLRHNGAHGLHSTSGTFSVTNNTFLNNGDHGLYNIGGTLSVTNNTFTNNTNYAAYLSGVTITSLRDNIGSGNGKNGWGISGTVSTNQTWDTFFPYIILGAGVIVNDDKILTLEPGVVVKFNSSAYMEVRGTLNASGTASEKIVFTSLKDDSYGGDTNGDGGASSPAPGDWKYIKIYGLVGDYDGIGIFEHSIIRYGGSHTTWPANVYSDRSQSFTFKNSVCEYSERIGILSYISSPVITNSTLRHNGAHGLHSTSGTFSVTNNTFLNNGDHGLYNIGGTLSVTNNTFTNNTNYAAYLSGVTITSLRDNIGSGNGKNGWGISGTVSTNQTWDTFFPYIILGAGVIVNDDKILTLEPGVVVKFNSSAYMEVRGTLNASGTASEKIVFTSLKDDSYGGDTNGDGGASSPAPGDWKYIKIYGLVGDYDGIGIFEHSIIRYGGHQTANVYSDRSQSFTFKNSVCEYSERIGILSYISSPVITNSTLRHNGAHGLHSTSGTFSVTNNTFLNNGDHGLYNIGGTLSVTNNTFTNNTNYAAYLSGVTITSLRDNIGSGNGKNGWGISGTVSTNQTWDTFFPYIILGAGVIVNDDKILTLEPGVVVKFNSSAYMEVRGTLNASGTASEKIVFTSLKDDSYGGDTNGDGGASSPAPGDWKYIKIYGLVGDYDGIGIFEHSIIRYGGHQTANVYSDRSQSFTFKNSVCEYSERIGILSYISSPVITNSTLRHNGAHGLHSTSGTFSVTNNTFLNNGDHGLYNIGGTLSVTNNTFTNNTNYAAYLSGVTITSLRDNIGSGNGKNGWGISGTVSTNQTWDTFFPYIILSAGVIVNDDKILTLEPGVVVKFNSSAYMEVRGTLNASGTASEKIVFTSLKDDSYGGDTNGDGGASSPAPGDWKYIKIYGLVGDYDGIGIFEHSIIRYGGHQTANVYSDRSQSFTFKNSVCEYSERIGILSYISSPVITNSTLRHNGAHGLHSTSGTFSVTNNTFLNNGDHGLYNIGGTLSVTNNTFTNNTNYAAYLSGVTITSLRDNIGSGNGKNGWGISGTVSTNQTWDTFFPYIILSAGVIVNDDKILTLEPGVVVKFNSSAYMEVRGTLNASGTASEKIVFTSLKDDSYGGDTNGDGGASSPAPGDWKYIKIYGLVGDYDGIGIFEHSIIRYGGHQTANVYSDRSQSFTFKNSVCEYSERNGIYLHSSNGGNIIGNTITSNNQSGIYLSGSNSNLIYNNYFNNTNNAYDNGNNRWNTTKTAGTNIIGGLYLGGNYWSNYTGKDQDGDGLGDTLTPHNSSGGIQTGGDYLPLTLVGPDTTPPASITNLQNVTGQTWINWSWTNPPDADFNYTMVYLDGVLVTDTSKPCYNATGLAPDTYYDIGTHTVDTVGNINTTWVNQTTKTLVGPDTTPPASITNLQNVTGQTWINWSWTNPPDADFNYTMVYLDGVLVTNTSKPCYNATGLAPDTYYEIGTHTVDTAGNMNTTWVNQTTKTLVGPDTTPPASITNLQNVTGQTWINWSWTNPPDADFNYTMVYLDGVLVINTSNPCYNATGLAPDTYYEIGTHTVDTAGNMNTTWVNQTTKTLPGQDTTPPVITNVTATNITMNSATISWDTDEPSDSLVKYGTESGNYVSTAYDAADVTTHRIALTGLSANTTYYYVVNSTDASGNSNESLEHNFSTLTPPTVIPANVVIKPETLNLNSTGVFTAFITLPEGYNMTDIDISTVICEGALAVKGMVADDNKYIAKFDREDLIDVEPGDAVTIAVTGTLYDGTPFAGNDTITVISEG